MLTVEPYEKIWLSSNDLLSLKRIGDRLEHTNEDVMDVPAFAVHSRTQDDGISLAPTLIPLRFSPWQSVYSRYHAKVQSLYI